MKRLLTILIIVSIGFSAYGAETNDNDPLSFRSGNTYVKFGGFINFLAAGYIDGATLVGKDFIPSQTSMSPTASLENRFFLDGTGTRLSVKMVQTTKTLGDISLFVEADFSGSGNTLFFRVATIDFKGFTFGQTWSNMTDHAASVPTIDLLGINSRSFFRTPQIAYKYNISDKYMIGASLELPIYRVDYGDVTPEIRVPDVILFAQTKGKLGHLKAAGVWRSIPYCVGEAVESDMAWGAQLSGSLNVTKSLLLCSQGIYGENISKYICDFGFLSYDLLETDDPSVRLSSPMYGVSLGAKYAFTDKVALSASYGQAGIDIDESYSGDIESTYKTGTYFSGNILYNPVKQITTGVEYLYGTRENYNGDKGSAQRINLLLRYSF